MSSRLLYSLANIPVPIMRALWRPYLFAWQSLRLENDAALYFIQKEVDVRLNPSTVEVIFGGRRVASQQSSYKKGRGRARWFAVVVICFLASMLAIRTAPKADPAEVTLEA